MDTIDAVVVGAGVVGLATAARLARPGNNVVVLERHQRHGLETSSRNSEVIHAGLHYPPESLKARLCVAGRRRLYEIAARHGVFCRRTGKLLVACVPEEVRKLEEFLAQGRANGVEGLELVDQADIPGFAPGVRAVAGLWSPETGIVDTEELMRFFLLSAQDAGAIFLWNSELESAARQTGLHHLRVKGMADPIPARCVVNAAGLHSDAVAALAGVDPDAAGCRLHWFKGEYFSLKRALPIKPLVYPVPTQHGLGIHLTVDRLGRHRLGPNAFPVQALDYDVDASHRQAFFAAAARYLPELRLEDLAPGTAGIRPKLSKDGSFRDFVIAERSGLGLPGWVDLVGIESPGLTASPAIADAVADLLEWPA
ncbi:MAG: NAD(P)/FAD-dependent oxidoreductase [Elusimicrobia bacterium]|nr:NAD(P)/FAD-dependent oxidoreductase [Elusimicrobiota bacterium]